MPDEPVPEPNAIRIEVEYLDPDFQTLLVEGGLIRNSLLFVVEEIDSSLSGTEAEWTFVLTGDMPKTIASRAQHVEGGPEYTVERGSNVVAARTLPENDGSFTFVFNQLPFTLYEEDSQTEIDRVWSNLRHLAVHESHHVILHLNGEDANDYQDLPELGDKELAFRKGLAISLDEFRIELAANRSARHLPSRASSFGDDIAHLRGELNASKTYCNQDTFSACQQVMTAAMQFITALAYLAAEIDEESDGGTVPRPDPLPEGWEGYVEPAWEVFYKIFRTLPGADERITAEGAAEVLSLLCTLVPTWLGTIGIDYGRSKEGEYCYWTREKY